MGNLSLVFHVTSLFLLAALVLWVLRLQTMLKVWRDWAVRGDDRRIVVGEPIRVLRQFSCAIGANFASDISVDSLAPARVRLEGCFELHSKACIESILVENNGGPGVCFVLRREPGTMDLDIQTIVHELGGSLTVRLTRSSASAEGQ